MTAEEYRIKRRCLAYLHRIQRWVEMGRAEVLVVELKQDPIIIPGDNGLSRLGVSGIQQAVITFRAAPRRTRTKVARRCTRHKAKITMRF